MHSPEGYNPSHAIAELIGNQKSQPGSRLAFSEKCAAFYALHSGVKPGVVARAFGVTPTTASMLKGCLKPYEPVLDHPLRTHRRDRHARYPEVAQEFWRLGEDVFRERYFTEDIFLRLQRIAHEVEQEGDDRTPKGPNPRADKCAFKTIGAFMHGDNWWRVDWLPDPELPPAPGPDGWYFIDCLPNGDKPEGPDVPYRGREFLDGTGSTPPTPFQKSKHAYSAIFTIAI